MNPVLQRMIDLRNQWQDEYTSQLVLLENRHTSNDVAIRHAYSVAQLGQQICEIDNEIIDALKERNTPNVTAIHTES